MSAHRPAPTATLRGGAVGALAAGLAVAAHGVAGGGFPGSPALTLLLAACAAIGAAVGGIPVLGRSRVALLAALAAGQGAGHLALTVISDSHVHEGAPATAMLAAHAAATVACAGLVLGAERLYGPITRVIRAVLAVPSLGVESPLSFTPPPSHRRSPRLSVLAAGLSRRGPPLVA